MIETITSYPLFLVLLFPISTFALLVIGLLRAPMEKDSLWTDIRDQWLKKIVKKYNSNNLFSDMNDN